MTATLWRARYWAPVRAVLLPTAAVFRLVTKARTALYAAGWRRRYRLPAPVIVVGNLTAGGTGKTPITQWVAGRLLARGVRPGILLRDVGGDEAILHRRAVPGAIVRTGADRARGGREALRRGAQALVLDDGFQRHDIVRDLDLVLVSADAGAAAPWPLPAGPWREGWGALRRADVVVVTRRAASDADVQATLARVHRVVRAGVPVAVARLAPSGLRGLRTDRRIGPEALRGRHVLAAAAIGDPHAFGHQLEALGARVIPRYRRDHFPYPARDVRQLLQSADEVDYVVTTAKDAVKLRKRWPVSAPEPLVAELGIEWEAGRDAVEAALARTLSRFDAKGDLVGGRRPSP